jgi:outer membrane receptor protein involved in Fe transport
VYKSLKADVHYYPNEKHNFVFGAEIVKYDLTPGEFTPLSSESDITVFKLPKEQGVETGLYISDNIEINRRLSVSLGLRLANFFLLGPYKEYVYNPLVPKRVESRMDSVFYAKNEVVNVYGGPEIRFSSRYTLGLNNSLKLSYNRIHQFIHMLSNSSAISPTDVWKISDPAIKPLIGDQIALGYYHNLFANTIEFSAEVYYKQTKNHIDYKTGSNILLNPDLDVSLLSGNGRAYGLELLLKKDKGLLNGWISYAYSKSELKIDGKFVEEKINNGKYYPTDFDKPHNVSVVANYQYSKRFGFSSIVTYSTGRPLLFRLQNTIFATTNSCTIQTGTNTEYLIISGGMRH